MTHLFEPPISTSNLYEPNLDRVCAIIDQAADAAGRIAEGSLVAQLEARLKVYHGARHCIAFSTGFWALVAAVCIRSLRGRRQVIIPSLTYRRLADVVYWAGRTPLFVDVEPNSLAICPDAVENAISDDCALILAVHPIVNCCDVQRLLSISDRRCVPIVFDAVESVHETVGSQRVGSFGVGEVFSLHASKLINGMEGGYVCTDDADFADSLISFRSGHSRYGNGFCNVDDIQLLGLNGVLNDGHAALALAGLEEIDCNVTHNESIYKQYLKELRNVEGVEISQFSTDEQTSYKNVVAAISDDYPLERDDLIRLLNSKGILARAYYAPPLHSKSYEYQVDSASMQVTRDAAKKYLNLPCGQRVTPADVTKVCQLLRSIATAGMP